MDNSNGFLRAHIKDKSDNHAMVVAFINNGAASNGPLQLSAFFG
jgi:hypothetical protein